jgi:hypothetical protein
LMVVFQSIHFTWINYGVRKCSNVLPKHIISHLKPLLHCWYAYSPTALRRRLAWPSVHLPMEARRVKNGSAVERVGIILSVVILHKIGLHETAC